VPQTSVCGVPPELGFGVAVGAEALSGRRMGAIQEVPSMGNIRMKVAVLALFCAVATLGSAQTKSAAPAAGGTDWIALDRKWLDSERTGDLDYLEKFFADSYVLVLANGQMYTKKEWLDILRGPDRPTLVVLNPENITVHNFGNVAILTDHTTVKGHDSKGNSLDGEFNVFRVVIKQNGMWKATGVVMNQDSTKK
jgi:ketosteroid isomerase-like protein